MGQVTIRVNGYGHTIGCKDGEEQHVLELASQIEAKTRMIRSMGGQFSESRMLLHVCLLLADEAGDMRAELERMAAAARGGGGAGAGGPRLAERLTRIAERIEGLAGAFDAPPNATGVGAAGGTDAAPAAGRG
jgi:cell division protein ZapA